MTDRKKPGVAFWATVGMVVVLVGYPLSFGPACWLSSWLGCGGERLIPSAYWPILIAGDSNESFSRVGECKQSWVPAKTGIGPLYRSLPKTVPRPFN